MTKNKRRYGLLLSPLITIGLVSLAFWQRQYIFDEIKLYGYKPSAVISQLATDTAMSDGARKVFYVNQPELFDKQRFSSFCTVHSEQTAVLGCYKGPQRGIYLLSVDNKDLDGIEEVTAAHEMLHAEYDRLSGSERVRINGLLENFYNTGLKDETTKKTIDSYRKSAKSDVVNEMHSILATQISTLTPELEDYYAQYFRDRTKVVTLYQTYEAAFSSRQQQIDDYDQQLSAQKANLNALEASVKDQGDNLRKKQAELERSAGSTNASAYNAQVDTYNASVNEYNVNVRRLRSIVEQFNQLVEKRNAISFEEQKLVEAISAPSVQQQ